ncbi:MAG TPA: nuclear transport factor 2 family protein [Longimicrobiales bacterium]|nr:nuclear transport factor 2 family protein [Longimicrobiales bacterium]
MKRVDPESILATGFAVLLGLILLPAAGEAQIRPGIERRDYWGEVRARYRGETLEEVGALMEAWIDAWNQDDVEGMLEAFAEDGVLVLDRTSFQGRDRIRAGLSGAPRPAIVQSLSDFDVRGDMAFATARHPLSGVGGGAGPDASTGLELWIFVKEEGDWRIRSLVVQSESSSRPSGEE